MTTNRRIALNAIATYGRSLYAMVLGVFSSRWILAALGEVDYGLLGVVGGLTAFVLFVNGLLSGAICRFYAFAVGQAESAASKEEGVEECRKWFSLAVFVHTLVPILLVVIGYPIGVWAICNFLTIPPDRIEPCIWVWRFTCLNGFVGMVNVPFNAMYVAKQEIAELTIYSFATTTLNFLFLILMISWPGDWLVKYCAWSCFLSVTPQVIICVRAILKYQECRFRRAYMFDRVRLGQVLMFAGGKFLSAFSLLVSGQGLVLVVNKYLGPAKNAAMTIGNTISSQASTLSSSLGGAFAPAITNAAGACNFELMRAMIYRACRFSTAAVLVFAIPLSLEIKEVATIWLKNPPDGVATIAVFMLADLVQARWSDGHALGIFAMGKIFKFQMYESLWFFMRLLVGWFLVQIGWDLAAIGIAYLTTGACAVGVKIWFGRKLCGLSARYWFLHVFSPLVLASLATILSGLLPRMFMVPSFARIIVTTIFCEVVYLPAMWLWIFSDAEKSAVLAKLSFLTRRK